MAKKKKSKKLTKEYMFLIIFAVIVLVIFLASLIYKNITIYEVRTIPADINVAKHVGINLNNDSLHFGTTFPYGGSKRDMTISFHKDALVEIKTFGEMKNWIYVSDNNFFLPANTEKELTFEVFVPSGTDERLYNGTVKIYFKRP
jgi:hypothetical protein